jgi:hypothetical protein
VNDARSFAEKLLIVFNFTQDLGVMKQSRERPDNPMMSVPRAADLHPLSTNLTSCMSDSGI